MDGDHQRRRDNFGGEFGAWGLCDAALPKLLCVELVLKQHPSTDWKEKVG